MVLSLLSLSNTVYFDTGYLVTLCNSLFFQAQATNTTILKMATSIIIRGLEDNKHVTDQYAMTNIYISAKNSQKKLVTVHIQCEIYLILGLKANMLVKTKIIILEQFVLDFNKKTAFIESCFCLFNLDIETL